MTSITSFSELITGPDQNVHRNKIVTGQNRIPIKGERYLSQYNLLFISTLISQQKKAQGIHDDIAFILY